MEKALGKVKLRLFYMVVFLLSFAPVAYGAEESGDVVSCEQKDGVQDSSLLKTLFNASMFKGNTTDSLTRARHKKTFFHRVGNVFTKFFREFNNIDTTYIEPQHYNYTFMLQETTTYEKYTLSDKSGQKVTFAPDMTFRLGPYIGWRWVFLGYTFDLSHISLKSSHTNKQEFDLSLYSSMLSVDLFWRQTGNDYKIEDLTLKGDVNTSAIRNTPFSGLKSSIRGFNLYYVFNHRKFSYPAAYSQSTVQRKSAGTPMVGIGYTRHKLDIDLVQLESLVREKLSSTQGSSASIDTTLYSKVKYTDVSISGGYAYNWVFAKNFLLNATLTLGLAYNSSSSDTQQKSNIIKDFSFKNFNMDAMGRFGLVWNNTRWYAGMSAILHSYNYKKEQFSTNNSFGSFNIYVGFNFGKK